MHHHAIGIFAIACGLAINAGTAQAAPETWVSGTGTDAGNCPRTAPCRTFLYAHSQTTNNGAIKVLTSGNFGPLTIKKSISIVAEGVEAVINTPRTGSAIRIEGVDIVVSLRGLTIDMRGSTYFGIVFVNGAALHVHNCIIRAARTGITFGAPPSGTRELYVTDSRIADSNKDGIHIFANDDAIVRVVLERVRTENNGLGAGGSGIAFRGTGSITATVRDSAAAGNEFAGIVSIESGGGTTNVMVDRTALVNNDVAGIRADGAGATIRIGDSVVTGNGTGLLLAGGGAIVSYGTNKVDGNGTDGAPSGTIAMK